MGIADFFRAKHRHSDPRVRAEAVRALSFEDRATELVDVAKRDADIGIRRIAIAKIQTPEVLSELAESETERSLREYLAERANELYLARACSDNADAATTALNGMVKLGDQRALVDVVVKAAVPAIRKRAFGELRDPRALAELAKREAPQELRTAAVARIDDGDVLRALAIDTSSKEVGLAAVEKLDDVDRLENVALKAKHKAVRQKARKIVAEIQEAEKAAKSPATPDDVKRKRAERAQLLRTVEGLADTFDFAKAAVTITAAEAAWAQLGTEDRGVTEDPDGRFAKSVKRFWKRKDVHDQQSRSADELRVVQQQAERERDQRAAEAARAAAAEAAAAVGEPDPDADAKRAAREAEAATQRGEQDARRADEDARRAAQSEERALRQREDTERGAAIEASLGALIADMEQLAEQPLKETKELDRVLNQAGRSFEQIGKVPPASRDAIADRYRAARGKLVAKAGDLREADDWLRWSNVPKAEALIDTAKQMVVAEATPDLGNRLRALQALWKEVGPMPQRRSKELWDTFKVECDKVYEKVRGVRAVEDVKFVEVAAGKEQLISEAEALAESTDWAATAEKLKSLQVAWKDSGHLPRKQGDELWKRFRAACDKFFERRKPLLDAQFDEQARNLAAKQALIARAHSVANTASAASGWGQAIGQIKDLQAEWKEIGFVPRRDADAVYKAFRAACDAVFTKRDDARDGEANAHRAELAAVAAEIDAVMAGGEDVVPRAISVRATAKALGAHAPKVDAMIRHLLAHHASALVGTELDPTQLRAKREQLIARAEALLPKPGEGVDAAAAPADLATRLKQAMQKNAFGELRFSGRDPVEVVAELRAEWTEGGPLLDDTDRAQHERFEATAMRVLDAAGEAEPDAAGDGAGERGMRRRRDRHAGQAPVAQGPESDGVAAALAAVVATPAAVPASSPVQIIPDAAASAVSEIAGPEESTGTAMFISPHDAVTRPSHLPPEVAVGQLPGASPLPEPPRRASHTSIPPMEEIDGGWDDDPTASPDAPKDGESSPSSQEMAGDGSVEGDGLDDVD